MLDSDGEMEQPHVQGRVDAAPPVRRSERISYASSALTRDKFQVQIQTCI